MRRVASLVPDPVARAAHKLLPARLWAAARDLALGESTPQRRVRALQLARLHWRESANFEVPVAAVEYRGEQLLARVVTRFRSGEVLARNAAFVLDALEAARVPHVVIDAPRQRRRVVALGASHLGPAIDALRVAATGRTVYASWVTGRRVRPSSRLEALPPRRGAHALRVFEPLASPGGDALGGIDFGCDLEIWTEAREPVPARHTGEPLARGALLAPRANRWTDAVDPHRGEPGVLVVDGVARPGLPSRSPHHQLDITFPIDVVYTWVDGDDPTWQARKRTAHERAGLGTLHEFAVNESRFTSRDELRYSMRSLDMYADWVRQVYLVTDDQVPDWLDTSHPKLRLVSHRQLFGERGQLPTFNSHAIESQLHHLDGLSEHYLYLNDDVFFGRPVSPDVFFWSNGLCKFFTSNAKLGLGQATSEDMPAMSAGKNNRDLLHKTFDVVTTNKFKHVPHAQRRSVVLEMEERFPDIFAATASHQFRRESD